MSKLIDRRRAVALIPGLKVEMREGEVIRVGDNIQIQLCGAIKGKASIAIDAPKSVRIERDRTRTNIIPNEEESAVSER